MSKLCIIPARGGSKRIPRKNIKDFLGKPIIAYSIETALKSGLFDEVMVSTDDEEIAQVAKKYGANVPFMRTMENSDDFATLADVVDEVLFFYKKKRKSYKWVCCILPTAPLIQLEHLEVGYRMIQSSDFDSIKPVGRFNYPIQRALKLKHNGKVSFFYPEFSETRSQDLETAYHDVGQFYWIKGDKGLKTSNKGAFTIDEKFVQDIDTLEDWQFAELKYKFLK